jgi:hypothetical protein
MDEAIHATLEGWTEFYLIAGTAAAALTGLQFVVATLIAGDADHVLAGADPEDGLAAFGSPTVVHFSLAMLVSAVMCVPWPGYGTLRATLGVLAVGALGYSAVVLRRALRQRSYRPVMEDWIFHLLLPCAAYVAILLAGLLFRRGAEWPAFAVGGATLLLICVGIHNAWDTVTFLTINAIRTTAPAGAPAPAHPHRSGRRGRRRR